MSIELIAIADNAIGFLPDGTRTVTSSHISAEKNMRTVWSVIIKMRLWG